MTLLNPRETSAFFPSLQEIYHPRARTLGDVGNGKSLHCVDLLLTVALNHESSLSTHM